MTTTPAATSELDHLDQLGAKAFAGFLVRKDLVRKYSRQYPVPTYVVEFLLGRYCASRESGAWQRRTDAEAGDSSPSCNRCWRWAGAPPSNPESCPGVRSTSVVNDSGVLAWPSHQGRPALLDPPRCAQPRPCSGSECAHVARPARTYCCLPAPHFCRHAACGARSKAQTRSDPADTIRQRMKRQGSCTGVALGPAQAPWLP